MSNAVPPYPHPNSRSTPRPALAARALQGTHAVACKRCFSSRRERGFNRFRFAFQFTPSD
ncbi:hypothetical protein XvhCFBP2543_18135 [Xanthomonas vasicola]|uniref:Uncharacterized protein n=1 Tax=Xanthomonas vasicola TaxID=56459 RepID=A0ABD7SA20_XANVA|nr:hypothetical protein NX81_003195 [Xanthomonas vasicola]RNK79065.1 hypothetical protein C9390_08330 [Xanthomonas vasicola pv. vasculorum]PPV01260.1 hypothetical protein XvhCFBP2543_18135 [Xanthomonas vasicola]RNL06333.1 hypothetical protein C9407_08010 [Xanthomonas vasicola pv. vasculorum]TWQ26852.1 hypothetical protein FQJ97_03170 [Xanthomonas vasicola]